MELILDSATDTDNEPLVEAFNGDDIAENDHRDDNEPADKVDYQLPIEQPKKQKLKNLDKVLDEGKCQDLPAQQKCCFKYMGAKKTVKIKWQTVYCEPTVQPRGTKNIVKNRPGRRGLTKRVKTPLELFKLFFTNEMLEKIVIYTNNSIEPALERYSTLRSRKRQVSIFSKSWQSWYFSIPLAYFVFEQHFVSICKRPERFGPTKVQMSFSVQQCCSIDFSSLAN